MLCIVCGKKNEYTNSFCPNCGSKTEKQIEIYDGFLSYRRSYDGILAKWIKLMLEKIGGKNIFLDLENINKGRFDDKIFNVIEGSENFLLVLSENSLNDCNKEGDWISKEIGHALKNNKNIIPILVDDFKFPADSQLSAELRAISRYNGVHYTLNHSDASIRKLLSFMVSSPMSKIEKSDTLEAQKTHTTVPIERVFASHTQDLKVATSGLIVVDAFIFGADIQGLCKKENIDLRLYNVKWSKTILDKLSKGHLDFVDYNESESKSYIEETPNCGLVISKRVCYSMGGKSFAVIVSKNSNLVEIAPENLLSELSGKNVYVSIKSDRFVNLCKILGVTFNEAKELDIHFIDIPDPTSLSILDEDPSSVLVGGQNIRFAAHNNKNYHEILNYDSVTSEMKKYLRDSSSNCIVHSKDFEKKLNISCDEFFELLIMNFNNLHYNEKGLNNLIYDLEIACDLPDDLHDNNNIIKHILFETYRIGEPKFN